MQKPQGGGKFVVQIPGVHGGMVMDEIDTYITYIHAPFICYHKSNKIIQQ